MNYAGPREKANPDGTPSGVWHYTNRNDDLIYPIGYCAQACPGHDSPDGAIEHQRQYEVDHAVLDGPVSTSYHPCQVCGAPTNRMAMWGMGNMAMGWLCDEHRTREHVASLVKVGCDIGTG